MESPSVVFVVDDDPDARHLVTSMVESVGLPVRAYGSATDFLSAFDPNLPGCLVTDLRLPGMSGLELQEKLQENGSALPVILVTSHGDVTAAVRAMKAGAVDFLEKPFNTHILLEKIHSAFALDSRRRQEGKEADVIHRRLKSLTRRETEVMGLVVAGKANKQVAIALDIGLKTVEVHRANVMRKMEAPSLAELVRMVMLVKPDPGKH